MVFTVPSLLMWISAASLAFFAVTYVFITWYYGYWKKRGIPSFDPHFPFGNMGELILQKTSALEYYTKMYNMFEGHPLAGYISIWEPSLLVRDPEITKQMLVKDFNYFHDRGIRFHEESEPLIAHLFNLSGKRWNTLRQKLSPTFTSGKMRYMFPIIKSCADEFQKTVMDEISKNRNEIEMKDLNARYTTDVIGSTAFGVEVGSLAKPDAEMRVIGRKIFTLTKFEAVKNFIFFLAPRLSEILKLRVTDRFVEEFFMKIVSETIKYRETNNIERNDFLQLLIKLKNHGSVDKEEKGNNPDVELTVEQLCAQAFVFFIGGFETSATTLTFCLYELAQNPDLQRQLACEIDEVLAKHNGELTYEGLSEMHLMDRVVSETLRLYPAVPVLFRECTKEYVIKRENYPDIFAKDQSGDLVIEKSTKIIFPICGIQRDPKYFPNPEQFDPERFTEEAKRQRPAFTHLPFGEGPRICIGMRFGNMQTKAGLAALLSKFELRPSSRNNGKLVLDPSSFVPAVKEGVFIKFYPRNKQQG